MAEDKEAKGQAKGQDSSQELAHGCLLPVMAEAPNHRFSSDNVTLKIGTYFSFLLTFPVRFPALGQAHFCYNKHAQWLLLLHC